MGQRRFLHQSGSIISHILLVSYYSHLVRPHPVAQPSLIFDSVGFNFFKFCGNLDNQNHANVNANIQYNSNQPAADRSINVEVRNKLSSHPNAIVD